MNKQKHKFDTFSLAEMFNETKASNLVLALDLGPHETPRKFSIANGDTWLMIDEFVKYAQHNLGLDATERVALASLDDTAHGLVFARLKSGLYRQVGAPNHGHVDGIFKRHDKKRAKWATRIKASVEFNVGARAHSHQLAVGA